MDTAALASEVRRRLGPPAAVVAPPAISIVVVNRDGAAHLRRLLAGLTEHTDYPSLELIVVDNASGDESVELLRGATAPFPIAIVANRHNESFSDACNQGAELASGELLLFLNNDVEPFEAGWLRELVACLRRSRAGVACATLIEPSDRLACGYAVQHRAIRLLDDGGMLRADLHGRGDDPLGERLGEDDASPVAAGACMLIERELFERVGGFTHGYLYGGEDIDLGLKVVEQERAVACSGRSLLIHRLGSTRRSSPGGWPGTIGRGNRHLLWERWGPRVRREYELDRLDGTGFWAAPGPSATASPSREEALRLSFCLKATGGTWERQLEQLRAALLRRGHRTVVPGEEGDELAGLDCDVAVHLRGPARHVLGRGQLNALWAPGGPSRLSRGERDRYQLVAGDRPAEQLIDAILARAGHLGLPVRLGPRVAAGQS